MFQNGQKQGVSLLSFGRGAVYVFSCLQLLQPSFLHMFKLNQTTLDDDPDHCCFTSCLSPPQLLLVLTHFSEGEGERGKTKKGQERDRKKGRKIEKEGESRSDPLLGRTGMQGVW